jgi:hypothetical protein
MSGLSDADPPAEDEALRSWAGMSHEEVTTEAEMDIEINGHTLADIYDTCQAILDQHYTPHTGIFVR